MPAFLRVVASVTTDAQGIVNMGQHKDPTTITGILYSKGKSIVRRADSLMSLLWFMDTSPASVLALATREEIWAASRTARYRPIITISQCMPDLR